MNGPLSLNAYTPRGLAGSGTRISIQEAWAQQEARVWVVRGVGTRSRGWGQARGHRPGRAEQRQWGAQVEGGAGTEGGRQGSWAVGESRSEVGAEQWGVGNPAGALWPTAAGQGRLGTQWALVRPAEAPGCRAGTVGHLEQTHALFRVHTVSWDGQLWHWASGEGGSRARHTAPPQPPLPGP